MSFSQFFMITMMVMVSIGRGFSDDLQGTKSEPVLEETASEPEGKPVDRGASDSPHNGRKMPKVQLEESVPKDESEESVPQKPGPEVSTPPKAEAKNDQEHPVTETAGDSKVSVNHQTSGNGTVAAPVAGEPPLPAVAAPAPVSAAVKAAIIPAQHVPESTAPNGDVAPNNSAVPNNSAIAVQVQNLQNSLRQQYALFVSSSNGRELLAGWQRDQQTVAQFVKNWPALQAQINNALSSATNTVCSAPSSGSGLADFFERLLKALFG